MTASPPPLMLRPVWSSTRTSPGSRTRRVLPNTSASTPAGTLGRGQAGHSTTATALTTAAAAARRPYGSTPRPPMKREGAALRIVVENLTGAHYLTGTSYLLEMWASDTVRHVKVGPDPRPRGAVCSRKGPLDKGR